MAIKFRIGEVGRLDNSLLVPDPEDPDSVFSKAIRAFLFVEETSANEGLTVLEFPILLVPFLRKLITTSLNLNYRYHRADFTVTCDCVEPNEFQFTYYDGLVFASVKGLESEFEHKFSGENLREFNIMAYSVYKDGVSKVRSIVGDIDGLEEMLAVDSICDVIFDESEGR